MPSGEKLKAETRARIQPHEKTAFMGYTPSLRDVHEFIKLLKDKPVVIGQGPFIAVGRVLNPCTRDLEKDGWWIEYEVTELGQIAFNSPMLYRALGLGLAAAFPFLKLKVPEQKERGEDIEIELEDVPHMILQFFDCVKHENEFNQVRSHNIIENSLEPLLRKERRETTGMFFRSMIIPSLRSAVGMCHLFLERYGEEAAISKDFMTLMESGEKIDIFLLEALLRRAIKASVEIGVPGKD